MNDLHKALGDIDSIRRQVADSTEFRGYGPATPNRYWRAGADCVLDTDGMVAGRGASCRCVPGDMDGDSCIVGWNDRSRDVCADAAHSCGYGRRDDPHGGRAIFSGGGCRRPYDVCELVSFVPGSLWMLPGLWQLIFSPGCVFIVPLYAATDDGCWGLVSGDGAYASFAGWYSGVFSVGDGFAICSWSGHGGGDTLVEFQGE